MYQQEKERRPASSFYKMIPGIKVVDYKEDDLIKDVSTYFKITVEQIKSTSRDREICQPRQVAMHFLAKRFPQYSYKFIGSMFSRNHSTVTHACKVVNNLNLTDKHFGHQLKELDDIIESHILKMSEVPKE